MQNWLNDNLGWSLSIHIGPPLLGLLIDYNNNWWYNFVRKKNVNKICIQKFCTKVKDRCHEQNFALQRQGHSLTTYTGRHQSRPGKSCKSSSSGKSRTLQCPQNSVIRDNGWTELYVLKVGVAWWKPQILITYPLFIAIHLNF